MTTPNLWLETAQRLQQQQQSYVLVTVLRVTPPTSGKPGDKAVVDAEGVIHGWIGGGCAQPAVIKTARLALEDGQPRTIRISPGQRSEEKQLGDVIEFNMACHSGGTLELFIDPVLAMQPLTVFGDSPVARALCDLGPRLGFAVQLVAKDARADDFPGASGVLNTDEPDAVRDAVQDRSWVVVATQGRRDLPALKAALQLNPRSLWLVASLRKAGVLKQELMDVGADETAVRSIIAPAGIDIGAVTAEEIALSVLGAVVAARRHNVDESVSASSCCGATASAAPEPQSAEVAQEKSAEAAPAEKKSCCGG